MPKKLSAYLLCTLAFVVLRAQNLPYERYTTKNGLVSDRITAITQDENGCMWFGSFFGICRNDGNGFEKIELPAQQRNKYVNCLLAAHQKIYAGFLFGGGLAVYDRGKVTAYFADAGSGNEFTCMADNGNESIIMASTTGDVYSFFRGRFTKICRLPLQNGVLARRIEKDRFNTFWIGTEQGLFLLPPPYTTPEPYFEGENVISLTKDENDVFRFTTTTAKGTIIRKSRALQKNNLHPIQIVYSSSTIKPVPFRTRTPNGLWQLDRNRGLFNAEDEIPDYYPLPLDLNADVNVIFADREHNIWIANEPGVLKISSFNIRTYLFEETAAAGGALCFLNDSVLLASNAKSLYTVTASGIHKTAVYPSRADYYGMLRLGKNNLLWAGFWETGIAAAIPKNNGIVIQQDYSYFKGKATKTKAMAEDGKGNVWLAGSQGLFRVKDNLIREKFQPLAPNGQPAFINCITIDEENQLLWLGENAQGIIGVRYVLDKDGSCRYKTEYYITRSAGLKDEFVRSILFDGHKGLWAGTRYGGIFRIIKSGSIYKAIDCNAQASLSCTRVTDIVSRGQNVWFAACDGVYRYSYSTNNWSSYNTSDGLLNAEVYAIETDPKGNAAWALTAQGITRLGIDQVTMTPPPQVYITGVDVSGKKDTAALQSKNPRYPSGNSAIAFYFAGPSFIDEKKVLYKYILEGYDREWSEPTSSNAVHYASLPPGRYRFKVMAANAKGQWSPQPAVFEFSIVMPFYMRSWFIFLCVTAALAIIYAVRLQRLRHRYRIEKLRLTIARDLHDDVGSTLGSINILSKTATRRLGKQVQQEEMQPIFEKIGEAAENTLDAMDDIVWSINPDKDKLEDLVVRMREFVIPLFEAKNTVLHFTSEGNKEQLLPMNFRRNVFLVYKEAVHNILKHSDATEGTITIQAAQQFTMRISDNGKGFVQTPSQRNGLKNMQNRAREVNARLDIRSGPGGTEIFFSAPLR